MATRNSHRSSGNNNATRSPRGNDERGHSLSAAQHADRAQEHAKLAAHHSGKAAAKARDEQREHRGRR